ncbi:hypothetical protein NDU88_005376 [Pleurodeles waltl]|uniref:CCHC-type domain-containing protein n=1 Tax=Pleurodeles waltl TaxID=8319 RepID=A0AAV7VJP2_PLEWA|nr:hypothetical protein NDU88_005376 [Pleurodeles waltl]
MLHGPERSLPAATASPSYPATGPQCYHCSETGHIARHCPLKKDPEEPMEIGLTRGRVFWSGGGKPTYTLTVLINNIERTALVDSGCSESVIRQKLVSPGQGDPQAQVLIACVHGDQRYYPVATVRLNWRGKEEAIRVGVLPHLDEHIILGTDYEDFPSLLNKAGQEHILRTWWEEVPIGEGEEESRRPRVILSSKQKREQRQQYTQSQKGLKPNIPEAASIVCTITGDFQQRQHDDPTLKHAWQQALNLEDHVTSTGHSPFELLFGIQPRTLLEMLAEQWEETEEEVKDLLTYTRKLRENLHTVWEEAHTTLRDAQMKQKQLYDAKSVHPSLKVGDKALVMLPSCENKLLARWQGPYEVIEQINPTTY